MPPDLVRGGGRGGRLAGAGVRPEPGGHGPGAAASRRPGGPPAPPQEGQAPAQPGPQAPAAAPKLNTRREAAARGPVIINLCENSLIKSQSWLENTESKTSSSDLQNPTPHMSASIRGWSVSLGPLSKLQVSKKGSLETFDVTNIEFFYYSLYERNEDCDNIIKIPSICGHILMIWCLGNRS